jgi:hypothetical protein
MYTESLPESHQLLTSLDPILCYTLHRLERSRLDGNVNPKIDMEVGKWQRHTALVAMP